MFAAEAVTLLGGLATARDNCGVETGGAAGETMADGDV